ncbi:valine--tRNA ligase [Candidatus Peregrinibacteria bacterium CG11_big_fil_rev_8_21_14_0_20_46_8]|nr:MAG: valine--tRNA ligase [Candidatus Peregrinibacteria bacterium CG11_big_fil_rev_8_21_14_0_20_46_8]
MKKELSKTYDASKHEDAIYKSWEKSGLFTPKIQKNRKPFVVMMPPPNATGTLHLGHAVMLAIEDILVRYHRMLGEPALWIPGTDHAGIATQNKVEKLLAEKGVTRHDLGRDKFIKEVEKFVAGSQNTIRSQVRKMGSSCDWTRERYTLEDDLSHAVRTQFVNMYKDGLIYRGKRIVNWCTRCSSTLADDEVVYKEERAKFYYLKYGPFVIGTARPETKFLDKIIVVHPDDKRYKKYHGKSMTVKWIEGDVEATILADKAADPEFGSGAMTITPAHDFVDFELAQRHGIEIHEIIDQEGNLTSAAGEFTGRNAREAREDIIKKLDKKGLVEKIDENYVHNLSLCYRCKTPIEPLVSLQWFINVDKKFSSVKGKPARTLKERAIDFVKKGKIEILPKQFEKTYFHWMENLHNWCISRQIWFGHRIPVWYCECKNPIVALETPKKCPHCGSKKLRQDPDTLDTWFSSGMWTFSTLGWPKKTKDLDYFHPTSVLETGYDILFFWVARMILMTSYALDTVPFETVYLHGLVRTRDGRKMSKSDPETAIDPLDMIEKYGADALRLSMVIGSTPGNDTRLYEEKIASYRNFINKIWNGARFALMQLQENGGVAAAHKPLKAETLADKWILTRTQQLIDEVTEDINKFRLSDAGTKIYDFAWGEYFNWYLEISKGEHKNLPVLIYVLKTILQLLHPFVPFVTEVLWKELGEKELLIGAQWPATNKKLIFKKEAQQMLAVIDVISAIRSLRHENNINPAKKIHAILVSKKHAYLLEEKREAIERLARLEKLDIETSAPKVHPALKQVTAAGIEIILPVGDLVDISAEVEKLMKEIENVSAYAKTLESKLKNSGFVQNAPGAVVESEREKLTASKEKVEKLQSQLKLLQD